MSKPPTRKATPRPQGWIGVDLDCTLAHYDHWRGIDHIGTPVPRMADRVRAWLAEQRDVRIFTARVAPPNDAASATALIEAWSEKHLGKKLPVTCTKDSAMIELWDDRAVRVVPNTGEMHRHYTAMFVPETAPRDEVILGDFGWPSLCQCWWNRPTGKWCYVTPQQDVDEERYFENEWAPDVELQAWLPLPRNN